MKRFYSTFTTWKMLKNAQKFCCLHRRSCKVCGPQRTRRVCSRLPKAPLSELPVHPATLSWFYKHEPCVNNTEKQRYTGIALPGEKMPITCEGGFIFWGRRMGWFFFPTRSLSWWVNQTRKCQVRSHHLHWDPWEGWRICMACNSLIIWQGSIHSSYKN